MLEPRDLEMIAELLKPLQTDIHDVKQDISGLKDDVTGLKDDVTTLKDDVTTLKNDNIALQAKVDVMQADLHQAQEDIRDIQVTLETDMSKKISIVAEGHLDLARKLDDALKVEQDKEMMKLQILSLQTEVRRLKERLESIA